MSLLAKYVENMRHLTRDIVPAYPFKTMWDWIGDEGRLFDLEDSVCMKFGPPRECFANAIVAALSDEGLSYCEGIAVHMIPTEHAWCVNVTNNVVVETTWDDVGDGYYGIQFPNTRRVFSAAAAIGYYGLLVNLWKHDDPDELMRIMLCDDER